MKKLMFAIVAAMTFGLFAADDGKVAGTSFENETVGAVTVTGTAVGLNDPGWTTSDSAAQLAISDTGAFTGDNRPAAFSGETNAKFLAFKTQFGAPLTKALELQAAPYFDTLIRLTACTEAPTIADDAKVAVWVLDDEDNGKTNVMVTACDLATGKARNYDCGALDNYNVELGAWCRLTVKTMDDDKAFVVFLDGKALVNAEDKGFGSLSDAALVWNANGKLFPSLDQTATTTDLSVVDFDGQGAVDDVVFTTTAPDFAVDDVKYLTLTWTAAQVSAISANGKALTVTDGSATIPVTKAGMIVTLAVTPADGYEFDCLGSLSNCTAADAVVTVTDLAAAAATVVIGKTAFSGGFGTAAKPYRMSKVDDFVDLNTWVRNDKATAGVYFTMTADLDWAQAGAGAFPGIGEYQGKAFKGVFDGANHKISNITFCKSTGGKTTYRGFFNQIDGNAVIRNLVIENVLCDSTMTGAEFGGAFFVGGATGTNRLENLTANGKWHAENIENGTTHNLAGIVGRVNSGIDVFVACTNNANLFCRYTKGGGFVAYFAGDGVFSNCCNNGTITMSAHPGDYADMFASGCGGFVSMPVGDKSMKFWNCRNNGVITGDFNGDVASLNCGQFIGSVNNQSGENLVDLGDNVGRNDTPAYGSADQGPKVVPDTQFQFQFAEDNGDGTVTFCAKPTAAGSYKVMGKNGLAISFGEKEGDQLILDHSVAPYSGTVTTTVEGMDAVASVEGSITTYTIQEPITAIQLTVTFDLNVTSVKVGETTVTETGATVEVMPGAPYAVVVKGQDWYRFGYGTLVGCAPSETGIVIGSDATAAVLPITATKVSGQDVANDPRPAATIAAEMGISNGKVFTNDYGMDGKVRLAKVVDWATTKSVSLADVNAIKFNDIPGIADKGTGPDPANLQAEAFLLNCEVTAEKVAEAKAAFKIPAFEITGEGFSFGAFEDGGDYGNGHLRLQGATAVDGEYTPDCEDPNFFKFLLQK